MLQEAPLPYPLLTRSIHAILATLFIVSFLCACTPLNPGQAGLESANSPPPPEQSDRQPSQGSRFITYHPHPAASIEPPEKSSAAQAIAESDAMATPPDQAIEAIIETNEATKETADQPETLIQTPLQTPQPGPDKIIALYESQQVLPPLLQVSDYYLSPGDVIEISVWGEDMTREVIVPPDGKISYFLIGQLKVAGRTMEDVRLEIEERLSEFILNPKVTVLGKSFIGNAASVLGAVNLPGQKNINPGDRVTDRLAKAGGISFNLGDNSGEEERLVADLANAYFSRQGKTLSLDLEKLLNQGDMRENIPVQRGDLLFIPYRKRSSIYALGEVNLPTVIHFRKDITLLDAIAGARGLKETTYTNEVLIVRGSLKDPEIIRVNFPSVLNGTEPNRLLEKGDIVYVPAAFVTRVERITRQIIPFLDAIIKSEDAF